MENVPILIIDDEPGILESLTEFLEDEGYEVHQADSGKKGLEIFQSLNSAVVMTDLRMPGMSGIEVIGEIRKLNEQTPIIVLTGYSSLQTAIDSIRLDVFEYIRKPVDLDHLKDTLDRARANVHAARQVQQEMVDLRSQLEFFQRQWKDQLAKFSEVEPLIHTGKLLAGILHNLNNPLGYIMGHSELLQILHPEIENIQAIQEQAVRMKGIMATIMKKIKESQIRDAEWLSLNDILREEVQFLESHPYFRIEIEKIWRLAPGLPSVLGVAAEFSQIFGNILRNAADAMKGQSIKQLILTSWHDSSQIHLSIKDTGPGIPQHLRRKVFEPFFSTKMDDRDNVGGIGMGIGLYHCQELIAQYQGHLEIAGGSGEGATFVLHLPVAATRDDEATEPEEVECQSISTGK